MDGWMIYGAFQIDGSVKHRDFIDIVAFAF